MASTMNSQWYDSYISYSNSEVFQAILDQSPVSYPTGSLHTESPDISRHVSSECSFRTHLNFIASHWEITRDTVYDKTDPVGFIFVLADGTICTTVQSEA